MKTTQNLTNAEKAKLLHELFPDELPLFLEFLNRVCADFEENKEEHAKHWNNAFLPFHFWLHLSNETARILEKYRFHLARYSRPFSEKLFSTYTSLFVNDQIVKYADHSSDNDNFKIVVNLLYESH